MGELYHICLDENLGIKYAILPGDPDRVEIIAGYLDNPRFMGRKREYTTYCGELCGEKVLVTSTGIGGPSTAIAVEELYKAGVRTFIRVGTCGAMQTDIIASDIIIATGAVRAEGTSKEYIPAEYPAVADFNVTSCLVQAAENENINYHVGVVQSKDSFYGQHSPERMPVGYRLIENWKAWIKAGCLASEMECAALFAVSSVLKAASGAVLSVVWNQEREALGLSNPHCHDTHNAIKTAIEGLKLLINADSGPKA